MIIQIEYDGSVAKCSLSGCIPTASYPNVDQHKTYFFNEADKMSQIKAIEAFRTIENSWMRQHTHDCGFKIKDGEIIELNKK